MLCFSRDEPGSVHLGPKGEKNIVNNERNRLSANLHESSPGDHGIADFRDGIQSPHAERRQLSLAKLLLTHCSFDGFSIDL